MTRIEALYKKCPNFMKIFFDIDEEVAKLIKEKCPGDILGHDEPVRDDRTATYDSTRNTTGCRGITCSECWEHEAYKEDANDQA